MGKFLIAYDIDSKSITNYDLLEKKLTNKYHASNVQKSIWTLENDELTCTEIKDELFKLFKDKINDKILVVEYDDIDFENFIDPPHI